MNLFILSRFIFSGRSPNRLRCRGAALHSYIDGKPIPANSETRLVSP